MEVIVISTWNSEFYNDRTWKKVRKSYMMSKNHVCEKCGEPAEIVHHKIHLSPENMGNFEIMYGEKNLQALARVTLLMALSNNFGNLVLSTGNKSELAVGYCTLYGDMVGGFAVLKDVYKTIVFELAKYRNSISETPVIPERVITRPPSAELRPDQKDQDSLPAYDVLDAILYAYIEEDSSQADIIARGFDQATVEKVIQLVDRNEYKRRQGAIGPRISSRAFSRERRYPIVNGWKAGI